MKKLTFVLLIAIQVLSTSCSITDDLLEPHLNELHNRVQERFTTNKYNDQHHELLPYLDLFVEDGARYGHDLSYVYDGKIRIEFADLETKAGRAYGGRNDGSISISIDHEYWNNVSEWRKFMLMYHELGHDILDLDHGPGIMVAGARNFNEEDKDKLLKELFK